MSKANVRRQLVLLEKNKVPKEKSTTSAFSSHFSYKHLKRIYPIGLHKSSSSSSLSLSSLSLSLSENSIDSSSIIDSTSPLDQKISSALRLIAPPPQRRESPVPKVVQQQNQSFQDTDNGELRRCNWITKNSDKVYVAFHDECWGVPVYDDNQLFELLALSGMLMDHNWTEIVKRRELFREAFSGFDPNTVAKMGEEEIEEIASNKALMLPDCKVRCIVDNAKCILKIVRECGSFSSYMWGSVNHKPVINRFRHPRNVPLRSPKAEAMSKDLIKRGFRYVGPVIVYSFMQAAGLTIDHLVDCYRYSECVSLAERPWRHI
ncbi:DNA-3-methyladenine glycosylase [Rosa chinensis]|uniref:DNA-3-methyladenine glycosylase n=1 Tax=Rosa chinensis TaxID=74649 RepID=UPI000D096B99|nr:DNA-3-methyladenine glycosylase [Rosa chinensis]